MVATLHKLTAGDGYTYLTRQVAVADSTERGRVALADYYTEKGERPGQWRGRGLAGLHGMSEGLQVTEDHMRALFGLGLHPLADQIQEAAIRAGASTDAAYSASQLGRPFAGSGSTASAFERAVGIAITTHNRAAGTHAHTPLSDADRAAIRSQIAREWFVRDHKREPLSASEFTSYVARLVRPTVTATAGYDITFTPVKTISALWAIAPRDMAEQIEAAHHEAVAEAMGWLEQHATFTRRGAGGVQHVDTRGLITAWFDHRDTRNGDPNLHTHVAISNKVQALDGTWLALDGSIIHRVLVAASERYDTFMEARCAARLGLVFEPRRKEGINPVVTREVAAVPQRLADSWSSRRVEIEQRKAELVAEFRQRHGRAPSPKEGIALAQQANLDTRAAKHEPRALADQRQAWAEQAAAVLGSAKGIGHIIGEVIMGRRERTRTLDEAQVERMADQLVATLEGARARFQPPHIEAEAKRIVRAAEVDPDLVGDAISRVVGAVLDPRRTVALDRQDPVTEPLALRTQDGLSIYETPLSRVYSTPRILSAEQRLVEQARRVDGRVVDGETVAIALLESTANGVTLNESQAELVRELAGSGRRVQLALAPAGAGKTTAMAVLASAWRADGGTIIGLAPTAVAAAELSDAIGAHADTLASLTFGIRDQAVPEWAQRIDDTTLVLIDEAGMADTLSLDAAITYLTEQGATIRLIGDDQQLASIAAGGALVDIRNEVGAVSLTELMRFSVQAEAAATLALRVGDPAALGFYFDHDRIHTLDASEVTATVFEAWQADLAAGRSSLMVAQSRETVTLLNDLARTARLADQPTPEREVLLASGVRASSGDLVITRLNRRTLRYSPTDFVRNGDRWIIDTVNNDGSVTVRHQRTGGHLTLPPDYVATQLDLGYSTTVHGAQGVTVDTCHVVVTGTESRQLLYVALSRGRHANHLYTAPAGDLDPHNAVDADVVTPMTARDVLERVLARDAAQASATSYARAQHEPTLLLGREASIYASAVPAVARITIGAERATSLESIAELMQPGLTTTPGWDVLAGHLALLDAAGVDPMQALATAIAAGPLTDAHNAAAVLDYRLDPTGAHSTHDGPLPWLPGIPSTLVDHPVWGPYLSARAANVTDFATQVRDQITSTDLADLPRWAGPFADHPELLGDLAVWRAVHHIDDTDLEPLGPPVYPNAERAAQRALEDRILAAVGPEHAGDIRWRSLLTDAAPTVLTDPFWLVLARRLNIAHRAGLDVPRLINAALEQGPLPAETPAAALWYRLVADLAPTAAIAGDVGRTRLRPAWTDTLLEALPDQLGTRVLRDPAWPGLVAAVDDAVAVTGKPAGEIIGYAVSAIDTAAVGTPDGLALADFTIALTWRVADTVHDGTAPITEPDVDDAERDAFMALWHRDRHATPAEPYTPEPEPVDDQVDDADIAAWLTATAAERAGTVDHPSPTPATPETPATVQAASISRARIVELNNAAADFYSSRYTGSGAAAYITSRFGVDLVDDARVTIGYAPPGWHNLTTHLKAAGASDDELLQSGLARRGKNGRLHDVFRDRVMLGVRDIDGALVGFIGRAAPGDPDAPKYLNTADTVAFHKGELLYGYPENREAFAAGAIPVRVEGPFDAIAVTLAGAGRVVGVAPMGTALTPHQADMLAAAAQDGTVWIATDTDKAGNTAAVKDYWTLAGVGLDTRTPALFDYTNPANRPKDPAELYQRDHGQSLARSLDVDGPAELTPSQPALAARLLDDLADRYRERLVDRDVNIMTSYARASAEIIAAAAPGEWPTLASHAAQPLGADRYAHDLVVYELADASTKWNAPIPARPTRPQTPASRLADSRARLQAAMARLHALPSATPSPGVSSGNTRSQIPERGPDQPRRPDGPTPRL